jgi:hypothetical protein
VRRDLAARASFRDPAGHVSERDGELCRSIAPAFLDVYRSVQASGLYEELQRDNLLVQHREVPQGPGLTLVPERVPFISYPHEWTPRQLRDAALLTLEIADRAERRGMVLRDASAYNIQFHRGRPLFIDTLSFRPRVAGEPWLAYGQFCRHFLAPLALAALVNPELLRLAASYADGIPLPVASRILGWRGRLRPGLLVHLHLHAAAASRATRTPTPTSSSIPPQRLRQIIEGLRDTIVSLPLERGATQWEEYAGGAHYSEAARQQKAEFVAAVAREAAPASLWDLGANTGELARQFAPRSGYALALDLDLGCVERCYASAAAEGLPVVALWVDLLVPSPASGWAGEERASLLDRGPADLVLALALIHHLAITGRIPMSRIAEWLARCGREVIVEVPDTSDVMVQRLLGATRSEGTYGGPAAFRAAYEPWLDLRRAEELPGIPRTLFHLTPRRS